MHMQRPRFIFYLADCFSLYFSDPSAPSVSHDMTPYMLEPSHKWYLQLFPSLTVAGQSQPGSLPSL